MMKEEKYSRYEFLKKMGFQGGALLAVLSACTHREDAIIESLIVNNQGKAVKSLDSTKATTPVSSGTGSTTSGGTGANANISGLVSTEVLATIKNPLAKIDLTATNTSALKTVGGYVLVNNNFVVARTATEQYVTASIVCTHDPRRQIIYNREEFYCTAHGARYTTGGQPLNTIARTPLPIYKTAYDGSTLVIFV
jgi:nitrite reductase/ring-hydroxylating ferredoxin subunit